MKKPLQSQFFDLYESHAGEIYRHIMLSVLSEAEAEDLTQETFARFWNYLREHGAPDNSRAYLYRIATNLLIDRSRRKKEASLDAMLESEPWREPAGQDRVDVERPIILREIKEALTRLSDEDAHIVTLRFFDDLDITEIAQVLNTTANNVSVKLHRAIKKLRGEMDAN
jgi:RNA polymerase sigma-70 factor (ECF subfamily)